MKPTPLKSALCWMTFRVWVGVAASHSTSLLMLAAGHLRWPAGRCCRHPVLPVLLSSSQWDDACTDGVTHAGNSGDRVRDGFLCRGWVWGEVGAAKHIIGS